MTEVLIHLGAHRTGTSTLQKFLSLNQSALLQSGVQTVIPPYSRQINPEDIHIDQPKFLISEENMLGTMENNLWQEGLYPDAQKQLQRYQNLMADSDKILFSIRNYVDFWTSVFFYCAKSQNILLTKDKLEELVNTSRGWKDVIQDIRHVAPNAEIIVRAHEWKIDNPKQQLLKVTGWSEFRAMKSVKSVHNARPNLKAILPTILSAQKDAKQTQQDLIDVFEPFSEEHATLLNQKYLDELRDLESSDDVRFLGSTEASENAVFKKKLARKKRGQDGRDQQICFLHIGKTGGTYIKSLFEEPNIKPSNLFLGGHGDTLVSTAANYGRTRKIAFTFRDPAERFVSGFLSRMRQGRPTYNINWTPAEAMAFTFFDTPNRLAEALSSQDERQKSAAYFAFTAILHLKLDYVHYLFSSQLLLEEFSRNNVAVCCETKNIDKHRVKILSALTGDAKVQDFHDARQNTGFETEPLSQLAKDNLKQFWHLEYELYETCQHLALELGFGDKKIHIAH